MLPDGRTSFNLIQNAGSGGAALVFFLLDPLFLDGGDLRSVPLLRRKERLAALLVGAPEALRYSDHQLGQGPAFHRAACTHGLEGIVSKRADGIYEPGRRSWLKTKCLNREEFVVVGWSDPEGSRHRIGALLLRYRRAQPFEALIGEYGRELILRDGFTAAGSPRLSPHARQPAPSPPSFPFRVWPDA